MVELEIADGSPWYLSTDLWTVPGDPENPPGPPQTGAPCYLWARVRNNGDSSVLNAQVRFYWGNPATGIDRTTAHPIGTSSVSLSAGQSTEVLCLTPWIPSFINGGHECVLAEVFHPTLDPLPVNANFNVAQDRHVAQKNLTVLNTSGFFHLAFEIHNPSRQVREFTIRARPGDREETLELLKRLGAVALHDHRAEFSALGFLASPCPHEREIEPLRMHETETRLTVGPGERPGLSLAGRLGEGVGLVHVEQLLEERVIGGLSVLVLAGKFAGNLASVTEGKA